MPSEASSTQSRLLDRFRETWEAGRLAHGYLLYGPEGIGKRELALNLAKLLLCPNGGCNECSACRRIEYQNHSDFRLIERGEGDKNLKIEHIRELQEVITHKAMEGPNKVFILADCQYLTEEAANALLKVLEEPPERSFLFLLAETPEILPDTIRSRCQEIRVPLRPSSEIAETMAAEYSLDDKQAHFLARTAEGSLGQAKRLHETGALEKVDWLIDNLLALDTQNELIFANDLYSRIRSDSKGLEEQRDELRLYLDVMNSFWRDLLYISLGLPVERLFHTSEKASSFYARLAMPSSLAIAGVELSFQMEDGLQLTANLRLLVENFAVDLRELLERAPGFSLQSM